MDCRVRLHINISPTKGCVCSRSHDADMHFAAPLLQLLATTMHSTPPPWSLAQSRDTRVPARERVSFYPTLPTSATLLRSAITICTYLHNRALLVKPHHPRVPLVIRHSYANNISTVRFLQSGRGGFTVLAHGIRPQLHYSPRLIPAADDIKD